MNKIIVTVVVFGFLLSSVALAHEEVGNIGLLPDSPLYFLKALSEKIKLSFTFSSPRRIQYQWELADRRLREIEALTAKGKGELVPKLFEKYGALVDQAQKRLEDVVGRGQDVGNLRTFVSEMREKHVEVLEEVLIQVPESAKDAIQRVVQRAESQLPVIESISPASGKVGALVTLVGSNFSPVGNTVSFAGVSGTGSGYLNDVKSADGSMLQFNVPEGLDVCISPPVGTAYCLGYAQLRPDSYEIAVISVRGKSNSVSFTVREGMVPIESPVTSPSAKISRSPVTSPRVSPPGQVFRTPTPQPRISTVPSPTTSSVSPEPSPSPSPVASQAVESTPPRIIGFAVSSVLDGRTKTTVTFNEPIDEDSLGSVTAYVTRENLPELRLDGTFEKSSNALSYLTNVGLSANTRYVMTVTKGVKDLAGNNLANDFSCTFTWQGSTISSCPTGLPPVVIKILSTGFSPEEVTLKVGMTVLFKNEDSASHWPAAGPHPTHTLCLGFDSNRALSQGETYQYTFTEAKTCPYHDHVSPGLTGKVIVE